jgi:hypothetical protein
MNLITRIIILVGALIGLLSLGLYVHTMKAQTPERITYARLTA